MQQSWDWKGMSRVILPRLRAAADSLEGELSRPPLNHSAIFKARLKLNQAFDEYLSIEATSKTADFASGPINTAECRDLVKEVRVLLDCASLQLKSS